MPELDDTESEVDSDDELDIRTVTNMARGMASSSTTNRKRTASKSKAKTTKVKSERQAPKRKVSKAKSKATALKYKRMSSPAVKSKTTPEGEAAMDYTPAPNRKLNNITNTI